MCDMKNSNINQSINNLMKISITIVLYVYKTSVRGQTLSPQFNAHTIYSTPLRIIKTMSEGKDDQDVQRM